MTKQDDKVREVAERWEEFWHDHQDFDPWWVRSTLHSLAEFLPYVFEFDAVEKGLAALYEESGVDLSEVEWVTADEDLPAIKLRKLPLFRQALALRAYAYYGLMLPAGDRDVLEFIEAFDSKHFPPQWMGKEIEETVHAARARAKLDWDLKSDGLTPEELAALAGVNRKSIMNLLAPSSRGPLKTKKGELVTLESARGWLLSRPDFRPSLWQFQEEEAWEPAEQEPVIDGEPVFVPVASDGTWFSPAHRRDGRYFVASGELEQAHDDYWSALDFLTRAVSPRWRYPDATERRWRMKSASGWQRMLRHEIEGGLLDEGGVDHHATEQR